MKNTPLQHLALCAGMLVISLSIADQVSSFSPLYLSAASLAALAFQPRLFPYLVFLWSALTLKVQIDEFLYWARFPVRGLLFTLAHVVPFALLWIFGKLRPRQAQWRSMGAWYVAILTCIGFWASYRMATRPMERRLWNVAERLTGVALNLSPPGGVAEEVANRQFLLTGMVWTMLASMLLVMTVAMLPAVLVPRFRSGTTGESPGTALAPLPLEEQVAWMAAWGLLTLLFATPGLWLVSFGVAYEACIAVGMALVVLVCLKAFVAELLERRFSEAAVSLVLIAVGSLLLSWMAFRPMLYLLLH